MIEVCAIFAIGPDNVIGIEDKMPWHSKQDFYHYKNTTMGYPCLFGDRTFFGLPKYPQAGRYNIVCNPEYKTEVIDTENGQYIKVASVEEGIKLAEVFGHKKIFICGGRSIYKYCLENNFIDTIYLTQVDSDDMIKKITCDPDKYIRFPIDIVKYLNEGWNVEFINYPDDVLPKETSDIQVKFLKCTKK